MFCTETGCELTLITRSPVDLKWGWVFPFIIKDGSNKIQIVHCLHKYMYINAELVSLSCGNNLFCFILEEESTDIETLVTFREKVILAMSFYANEVWF